MLQKFQKNGEEVGRLLSVLNDKLLIILVCETNTCNFLVDKGQFVARNIDIL